MSAAARRVLAATVALLALLGVAAVANGDAPGFYVRETPAAFADVVFDLKFAITERNFRITGENAIGKGLRDRGYADFPDVEVIHFCSLERARTVLLLDLAYVAQMPCRVTVHRDGDRTVVTAVLLPGSHPDPRVVDFALEMNGLLREIVDFAIDGQ